MLTTILIIFAIVVLALLAFAMTKPDSFRFERKILINASADKIFPYLNITRKALEWSPFEEVDPDMERSFNGPESGVGAKYAWRGDHKIGEGHLEIIESVENHKVVMKLVFLRPMKAVNTAEYSIVSQGGSSEVVWSMYGPNTFCGKLMSIFINCEKMCGEQFEKGLEKLKTITER